jgi:hypothetical protein
MWRPYNVEPVKFWFLDRLGWPVETVKGRLVLNFFRLLIHTRKITTRWALIKPINWAHSETVWNWNAGHIIFQRACDAIVEESNQLYARTPREGFFLSVQTGRTPCDRPNISSPLKTKNNGNDIWLPE